MKLRQVPIVSWVAYAPLLAVFGALLVVVLGYGAALGAPSLVWHDDGVTQLLAGAMAAGMCLHLGLVGYLLDSAENPDQELAPDDATFGSVIRYALWPVGVLWLAVVVGALRQTETRFHGAGVVVGPGVLLALFAWFGTGARAERKLESILPKERGERLMRFVERVGAFVSARKPTPPVDPGAHAVQTALMGAIAVAYLGVWALESRVPAAVAVGVALSLATGVWGLLRFWARRFRLLLMAAVALFFCAIGVTRDVPATGLKHVAFPVPGDVPRPLLPDEAVLEQWRARTKQDRPPLVVVATSGGASRAAVWTINVLAHLEGRMPGFLRHVRLITGASGGMVGAAHLVSALGPEGPSVPFDDVLEDAARDSLTPITRALILPRTDRGGALERAWENNTHGRVARRFRDLAAGEAAGWLPSLVYAPMLVEDGRRLVVSNLDLAPLTESTGPLVWCVAGPECQQSVSAFQLFSCRGRGIDDIKLSTVARLSATFPWVTSAALLDSQPDRRIVDAGYYDNFGVDLAAMWIRKNAAWLRDHTSGVLLVQIRDAPRNDLVLEAEQGMGTAHAWASAATTPIEAFLEAREATMSFRNDEEIGLLAADPRLAPGQRFFVTASFEFEGDAPLQWYLSRAAIDRLKKPPTGTATGFVERWWRDRR